MIKFVTKEKSTRDTFGDIEHDQFFVSNGGCLYQKTSDDEAHMLANSEQNPSSLRVAYAREDIVTRLPHVYKIEFSAE